MGSSMTEEEAAAFRPLQDHERRLLETLLDDHQFEGRDELRGQLESTTARLISEYHDNYGSIKLKVSDGIPSNGRRRVPVEGQYLDDDGIPVWLLLHVNREGFLCELEIVRADGKPLISAPTPDRLEVY
jgi:hypothetical protein